MSELTVGTLSGLAANSYVIDVASGSSLDLSNGATLPAGSVIQVVSTFKDDTFATTSQSPVDITGASVTITPSSATSKVLITFSGSFSMSALDYSSVYLLRDSTALGLGAAAGSRRQVTMGWTGGGESNRPRQAVSYTFLDSPNTTSAVTYKLQGAIQSGSTFYLGRGSLDADNNSHTNSRTGFTITAMEVAG